MLPASKHVESAFSEFLSSPHCSGKFFIDTSTIDPKTSQTLAQQVTKKGSLMIDAPVSGGVGGAEAARKY